MDSAHGFRKILVATDFSPPAEAALRQAIWLARLSGAQVVLAHVRGDLRKVVHSASTKAKLDLLLGSGDQFEHEVRQRSDARMRKLVADLDASGIEIRYETLLGEPFVEIIHAVQQEGYDLVLAGTRGLSAWQEFFVGSTAKRLVGKCPSSVWIVKAEYVGPPRVILAATDFSDVSRRAVQEGLWIAQQASADFHLLHVIDASDVPPDLVDHLPEGSTLRQAIDEEAKSRMSDFLQSLDCDTSQSHIHLSSGTPWKEIKRLGHEYHADLIAMGTVGRSGIKGVLLGSTAEKVLGSCDCSMLTIKPEGFESPISPASWPLHPA